MKKKIYYEAINPIHGNVNYYNELLDVSRKNRKQPTLAEKIVWEKVLMKKKTGYKFLRQKPIHRYIVDFYCSELNLAIEIDGNSHLVKKGFDSYRDQLLKQIGIITLKFTNDEVVNNIEKVRSAIMDYISPPCQGRGTVR